MTTDGQTRHARVIPFLPNGDYYFDKGITAYQQGDLERAKKFVERAIAFNPNEAEYFCQLAAILAELEQFEASNQILKKVVFEIDPSLVECFFFMANNFAYLGRYEEAIRDIKRYMSLEPHGSFVQEAKDLYKLLIMESGEDIGEVDPTISDHEKGRQALERGDHKKAIYYFQKALREKPTFWAAHNNLAIAYFSLGETEKALQQLENVLKEDPGNVHALCNQMTFYHQLDEQEAIEALLPRLHKLHPMYPESQSKLGATYFFLGDDENAYKWLKKAERSGVFEDQTFYYWLAVTCYHLGKMDQAMRAWQQVDFFSDSPFQPLEYGKIKELLQEEGASQNPLVKSLLYHESHEGKLDSQLVSLFILHAFADNESKQLLEKVSVTPHIEPGIGQVAKRLKDHLEGHPLDDCLSVMVVLQGELGNNGPLLYDLNLYQWWFEAQPAMAIVRPSDQASWAAALYYKWMNRDAFGRVSQLEAAERFGVTVYKLRQKLLLFDDMMFSKE